MAANSEPLHRTEKESASVQTRAGLIPAHLRRPLALFAWADFRQQGPCWGLLADALRPGQDGGVSSSVAPGSVAPGMHYRSPPAASRSGWLASARYSSADQRSP